MSNKRGNWEEIQEKKKGKMLEEKARSWKEFQKKRDNKLKKKKVYARNLRGDKVLENAQDAMEEMRERKKVEMAGAESSGSEIVVEQEVLQVPFNPDNAVHVAQRTICNDPAWNKGLSADP